MACAVFSLKLAHSIKSAPPSDGPFTRNADYQLSARLVIGWDTPLHSLALLLALVPPSRRIYFKLCDCEELALVRWLNNGHMGAMAAGVS